MIQAIQPALTFDEFLAQYPEDGGHYQLIDGVMQAMRPIGSHEKVAALIVRKIDVEIERLSLPYFIPRSCLVKPSDRETSGYLPDLIVLDQEQVEADPYWRKQSSISLGQSAKLVVEVVSTNWQDDYLTKLAEYEKLGIPEYWIVDYRALGGVRYIGSPKTPTVWVYELQGEEYLSSKSFRGTDRISSLTFPALQLTVEQLLQAGA
jgi:Uma2 family endonuclease